MQIQKEIDKYHLLDTSPVPWCVTEMIYEKGVPVDFRFQYVNDAVVDLLELDSKDQLLGKSSREAFQSVNEVWIDFYALISINGISSNNVIKSSATGKDIYVRSYRTVYGYVASIMQDIKVIKPVIENVG
jgi:PAS domain-containing protein